MLSIMINIFTLLICINLIIHHEKNNVKINKVLLLLFGSFFLFIFLVYLDYIDFIQDIINKIEYDWLNFFSSFFGPFFGGFITYYCMKKTLQATVMPELTINSNEKIKNNDKPLFIILKNHNCHTDNDRILLEIENKGLGNATITYLNIYKEKDPENNFASKQKIKLNRDGYTCICFFTNLIKDEHFILKIEYMDIYGNKYIYTQKLWIQKVNNYIKIDNFS